MGEEVSSQVPSFPRDFLRRFGAAANGGGNGGGGGASVKDTEVGGGGAFKDIELRLGLSLGGCFGAEPKQERLTRSSSTATLPAEHELPVVAPPLSRTCSLPAENEEMLRKRKQLQSLKRLQAKRKRLERKNSSKPGTKKVKNDILGAGTENGLSTGLVNGSLPPGLRLPPWSLRNGRPRAQMVDGSKSYVPASQASQGSISSSVSDGNNNENPTSKQVPALKENLEVKDHSKMSSLSEQSNHSATTKRHPAPPGRGEHNGARKEGTAMRNANGFTKAAERSIMESMPCVSTRGDGPNGRRIEGFLYKYRKGEEVRIVCVCHGSSLTPAEFVKHAGGGDVAHPLRHIVVSPSPIAML